MEKYFKSKQWGPIPEYPGSPEWSDQTYDHMEPEEIRPRRKKTAYVEGYCHSDTLHYTISNRPLIQLLDNNLAAELKIDSWLITASGIILHEDNENGGFLVKQNNSPRTIRVSRGIAVINGQYVDFIHKIENGRLYEMKDDMVIQFENFDDRKDGVDHRICIEVRDRKNDEQWSSQKPYSANQYVKHKDKYWVSKTDNNIGNEPDVSPDHWAEEDTPIYWIADPYPFQDRKNRLPIAIAKWDKNSQMLTNIRDIRTFIGPVDENSDDGNKNKFVSNRIIKNILDRILKLEDDTQRIENKADNTDRSLKHFSQEFNVRIDKVSNPYSFFDESNIINEDFELFYDEKDILDRNKEPCEITNKKKTKIVGPIYRKRKSKYGPKYKAGVMFNRFKRYYGQADEVIDASVLDSLADFEYDRWDDCWWGVSWWGEPNSVLGGRKIGFIYRWKTAENEIKDLTWWKISSSDIQSWEFNDSSSRYTGITVDQNNVFIMFYDSTSTSTSGNSYIKRISKAKFNSSKNTVLNLGGNDIYSLITINKSLCVGLSLRLFDGDDENNKRICTVDSGVGLKNGEENKYHEINPYVSNQHPGFYVTQKIGHLFLSRKFNHGAILSSLSWDNKNKCLYIMSGGMNVLLTEPLAENQSFYHDRIGTFHKQFVYKMKPSDNNDKLLIEECYDVFSPSEHERAEENEFIRKISSIAVKDGDIWGLRVKFFPERNISSRYVGDNSNWCDNPLTNFARAFKTVNMTKFKIRNTSKLIGHISKMFCLDKDLAGLNNYTYFGLCKKDNYVYYTYKSSNSFYLARYNLENKETERHPIDYLNNFSDVKHEGLDFVASQPPDIKCDNNHLYLLVKPSSQLGGVMLYRVPFDNVNFNNANWNWKGVVKFPSQINTDIGDGFKVTESTAYNRDVRALAVNDKYVYIALTPIEKDRMYSIVYRIPKDTLSDNNPIELSSSHLYTKSERGGDGPNSRFLAPFVGVTALDADNEGNLYMLECTEFWTPKKWFWYDHHWYKSPLRMVVVDADESKNPRNKIMPQIKRKFNLMLPDLYKATYQKICLVDDNGRRRIWALISDNFKTPDSDLYSANRIYPKVAEILVDKNECENWNFFFSKSTSPVYFAGDMNSNDTTKYPGTGVMGVEYGERYHSLSDYQDKRLALPEKYVVYGTKESLNIVDITNPDNPYIWMTFDYDLTSTYQTSLHDQQTNKALYYKNKVSGNISFEQILTIKCYKDVIYVGSQNTKAYPNDDFKCNGGLYILDFKNNSIKVLRFEGTINATSNHYDIYSGQRKGVIYERAGGIIKRNEAQKWYKIAENQMPNYHTITAIDVKEIDGIDHMAFGIGTDSSALGSSFFTYMCFMNLKTFALGYAYFETPAARGTFKKIKFSENGDLYFSFNGEGRFCNNLYHIGKINKFPEGFLGFLIEKYPSISLGTNFFLKTNESCSFVTASLKYTGVFKVYNGASFINKYENLYYDRTGISNFDILPVYDDNGNFVGNKIYAIVLCGYQGVYPTNSHSHDWAISNPIASSIYVIDETQTDSDNDETMIYHRAYSDYHGYKNQGVHAKIYPLEDITLGSRKFGLDKSSYSVFRDINVFKNYLFVSCGSGTANSGVFGDPNSTQNDLLEFVPSNQVKSIMVFKDDKFLTSISFISSPLTTGAWTNDGCNRPLDNDKRLNDYVVGEETSAYLKKFIVADGKLFFHNPANDMGEGGTPGYSYHCDGGYIKILPYFRESEYYSRDYKLKPTVKRGYFSISSNVPQSYKNEIIPLKNSNFENVGMWSRPSDLPSYMDPNNGDPETKYAFICTSTSPQKISISLPPKTTKTALILDSLSNSSNLDITIKKTGGQPVFQINNLDVKDTETKRKTLWITDSLDPGEDYTMEITHIGGQNCQTRIYGIIASKLLDNSKCVEVKFSPNYDPDNPSSMKWFELKDKSEVEFLSTFETKIIKTDNDIQDTYNIDQNIKIMAIKKAYIGLSSGQGGSGQGNNTHQTILIEGENYDYVVTRNESGFITSIRLNNPDILFGNLDPSMYSLFIEYYIVCGNGKFHITLRQPCEDFNDPNSYYDEWSEVYVTDYSLLLSE